MAGQKTKPNCPICGWPVGQSGQDRCVCTPPPKGRAAERKRERAASSAELVAELVAALSDAAAQLAYAEPRLRTQFAQANIPRALKRARGALALAERKRLDAARARRGVRRRSVLGRQARKGS